MQKIFQGDLIRISGFSAMFLVVSKNAFINHTGMLHVCPVLKNESEGPLHIIVSGEREKGTVICEQIKLIDPAIRGCNRIDRISYYQLMNISDAIQGIFEYD
ncbi:MAG: type II toxin-antitoxin system PemK/MazF family toxin [Lachnospiraceae bacterium]|nr:type II toxin-antitoxin system PemK/MazF family toxin [Lachnospiraceae bacterium]